MCSLLNRLMECVARRRTTALTKLASAEAKHEKPFFDLNVALARFMVSGASGPSGGLWLCCWAGIQGSGRKGLQANQKWWVSGCGLAGGVEEHAKLSHVEGCWSRKKLTRA